MSLSFWFLVLAAKNAKVAKGGTGISSRDVREVREVLEAAFAATTKAGVSAARLIAAFAAATLRWREGLLLSDCFYFCCS